MSAWHRPTVVPTRRFAGGQRSATSPISPASRSRRSRASSTTGRTSRRAPARRCCRSCASTASPTNRGARGLLGSGRTGMIGLTLPLVNDAYFGPMLSGATEALYEERPADRPLPDAARARPRGLDRRAADARHHRRRDPDASRGVARRAASRCSARAIPSWSSIRASVRPTASRAWRRCTRQAPSRRRSTSSSLGHRRIGAIAGSPGWYATEERLLGFRAALAGAGILLDPELIVYSDWRIPQGTLAADQLLSLRNRPTAIFGFNDNVAIGALHAARARGLSRAGGSVGRRLRRHGAGGDRHAAGSRRCASRSPSSAGPASAC